MATQRAATGRPRASGRRDQPARFKCLFLSAAAVSPKAFQTAWRGQAVRFSSASKGAGHRGAAQGSLAPSLCSGPQRRWRAEPDRAWKASQHPGHLEAAMARDPLWEARAPGSRLVRSSPAGLTFQLRRSGLACSRSGSTPAPLTTQASPCGKATGSCGPDLGSAPWEPAPPQVPPLPAQVCPTPPGPAALPRGPRLRSAPCRPEAALHSSRAGAAPSVASRALAAALRSTCTLQSCWVPVASSKSTLPPYWYYFFKLVHLYFRYKYYSDNTHDREFVPVRGMSCCFFFPHSPTGVTAPAVHSL